MLGRKDIDERKSLHFRTNDCSASSYRDIKQSWAKDIYVIYSYKLKNEPTISAHPIITFFSMLAWKQKHELLYCIGQKYKNMLTYKHTIPKSLKSWIVSTYEFEAHQQKQKLWQFIRVTTPLFCIGYSIIPNMMPSSEFSPKSVVCGPTPSVSVC